jgi:acetyltransferase-like isoleucine patch superfamily enzyme
MAGGLTASRFPADLTTERTPDQTGWRKVRSHLAAAAYNAVVTFIPSHAVRQTFLRAAGMRIGRQVGMLRGAKVTRPDQIEVGDHCIIGFDCFLGGEGRLFIGNNVNIASFSVLLGGRHDINDPAFTAVLRPTVIEDYAWVATRVTITSGVRIGRGAVVGAGAVVMRDVAPYTVVAGVPARVIGERRPDACAYELNYQPWFF